MRTVLAILGLAIVSSYAASGADQNVECIASYGTAAVEQFLGQLEDAVAKGDRIQVSGMIEFPIVVEIAGKRSTLRNRSELLKYYDVAFDSKVKGFIAKQRFSDLFCNWRGIMIGRGEICITLVGRSKKLKIIAINNNPPWSREGK